MKGYNKITLSVDQNKEVGETERGEPPASPPSTNQLFQRGGRPALTSVLLACLSLLMFLGASISSGYVIFLADSLKQSVTEEQARAYGNYWHVPGFNWQGYEFGQLASEFLLLVGAGVAIAALIMAYIGLFRSRKAEQWQVRRLAIWGMVLSHLCLPMGLLTFWVVFEALFSLFMWGFSLF